MTHLEKIRQMAAAIKELECNGLKIESGLIQLDFDIKEYHELEDEFKNVFSHAYKVDSKKLCVEFYDISFIILFPRM